MERRAPSRPHDSVRRTLLSAAAQSQQQQTGVHQNASEQQLKPTHTRNIYYLLLRLMFTEI